MEEEAGSGSEYSSSEQLITETETVSVTDLKDYISKLISLLLEASDEEIKANVNDENFNPKELEGFIKDNMIQTLFITKEKIDDNEEGQFKYFMNFEINFSQLQVASIALIKRYPVLQKDRPIQTQLQIINLPGHLDGGNPYETLHSYIHNAVSPYFNAYVSSKSDNNAKTNSNFEDKDVKAGIPMTRKKIAELELSLLHLQQNVEIPEIVLEINPVIIKAIEDCKKNNEDPKSSALKYIPKSYLNDTQFLDKLQKEVQNWVTDIRKVADLERDPTTGSASQEINFWLGMENSITSIEKQLIDVPVLLTLDVLKNAKRYHATISFHSDTGLMERSETVRKYAQVMKDFPINELLSAVDLDKVKEALEKIFNHLLKKLKVTLYPTQRSLPLVEIA